MNVKNILMTVLKVMNMKLIVSLSIRWAHI
nr:MAG TPA: hypothetical protein [Caudoviricetes sp.]